MKVLLIGAKGQLGTDLVHALASHSILTPEHGALDVTDSLSVDNYMQEHRPDAVINTSAFHDVPLCESDPASCFAVNAIGPRNLAVSCSRINAQLYHISTDYVFDGTNPAGYDEAALPRPLSVYGASKHYGEVCVQRTLADCYLVRTQWLYGPGGPNIIDTIVRLAKEQPLLRFVDDQQGCLTYTKDLARQIKLLLEHPLLPGVYHINNAGHCTWYEVALAVVELLGLSAQVEVQPITTAEMPRPARRPLQGLLLRRALELQGADIMPAWRDSLAGYLKLKGASG